MVLAVDGFDAGRREKERQADRDGYKHNKAKSAVWLLMAVAHWVGGAARWRETLNSILGRGRGVLHE